MALGGRGFVSVGAVVACCALAAACTSEPPPVITPAPTSAATTPTESQIERQMRLDYEAAEAAYRATSAEQDRLYQGRRGHQGDSRTPRNSYRLVSTDHARVAASHIAKSGGMRLRNHRRSSASCATVAGERRVGLTSCEDNNGVRFFDSVGKDVTPKGRATLCTSI